LRLDFDPQKSASHEQKHGIGFADAQALWDDPDVVEVPARVVEEPSFVVIGRIAGKHGSGIKAVELLLAVDA
jgi:hypothetical protein